MNRLDRIESIESNRSNRIDRINLTAEMDLWTNFKLFRPKLSLNRTINGQIDQSIRSDRVDAIQSSQFDWIEFELYEKNSEKLTKLKTTKQYGKTRPKKTGRKLVKTPRTLRVFAGIFFSANFVSAEKTRINS